MSGYYQDADTGDGLSGDSPGGAKRKRDDRGGIQHRTKRNRYISIACNECKRRKIKCNGETPCQRCGNLNLDCIYSPNCCSNNFRDSAEFKQLTAQVNSLQDQVNDILHNLISLRSAAGQDEYNFGRDDSFSYRGDALQPPVSLHSSLPIDPALQNRPSQQQISQQQQRFQLEAPSPLSMDLAPVLRNAEDAIHQGILSQADDNTQSSTETLSGTSTESTRDPIWSFSKDEALRLCRVFETDIGPMHAILDVKRLKIHANMLFKFIDAVSRTFMMTDKPGPDSIHDQDTDLLKLVLAVALTAEGSGKSDLGKRLFDFVNKDTNSRLLGTVTVKDLQILMLTALYYLYLGDENLARRVTGLTARLCVELGLHRSAAYDVLSTAEIDSATTRNLFWSIYILDHTWSLSPEVFVAIQDADIDLNLSRPAESSPYLDNMIEYARLCDEVRAFARTYDTTHGTGETHSPIDEYVTKVNEWHGSLPEHLRFTPTTNDDDSQEITNITLSSTRDSVQGLRWLRSLLYLRANYLKTALFRTSIVSERHPVLIQNATSPSTKKALDVAHDSIRALQSLSFHTDVYKMRPVQFDQFLLSAIVTILLAVSFAPYTFAISSQAHMFYEGLELTRRLSPRSQASKRLSAAVSSLKAWLLKIDFYADFLKLSNQTLGFESGTDEYGGTNGQQATSSSLTEDAANDRNEAQRSAAMAMAGLAGHTVSDTIDSTLTGPPSGPQDSSSSHVEGKSSEQSIDEVTNCLAVLFQTVSQPPRVTSGRTLNEQEAKKVEGKECRSRAPELCQILKDLL